MVLVSGLRIFFFDLLSPIHGERYGQPEGGGGGGGGKSPGL